jgi:hypothetical protein
MANQPTDEPGTAKPFGVWVYSTLFLETIQMATALTATRERVQVDSAIMATIGPIMLYAQASDGVWVPKCDLAQYEAGRRPWAS